MTISRWILLTIRNVSNKNCKENQNTHFMFSNFLSENRSVYEIMSKNVVEPERPQIIRRMPCCMLDEYGYTRASTSPRQRTHTHARTHPRARARAHTQICNTYCFSTATMVSWTRLSVTVYAHCLSCYNYLQRSDRTVTVISVLHLLLRSTRKAICTFTSPQAFNWWPPVEHKDTPAVHSTTSILTYHPHNLACVTQALSPLQDIWIKCIKRSFSMCLLHVPSTLSFLIQVEIVSPPSHYIH